MTPRNGWRENFRLVVRFLSTYARRHLRHYALGLLALLATNGLAVSIPQWIKEAINQLGTGAEGRVVRACLAIMGASVAIVVVRTLSRVCFFNPGRAIEFRVKNDLFAHLLRQPQRFYDRMGVGDIMSRMTNDLMSLRAMIGYVSLQIFNVSISIVLALSKMFAIDPWLTLACIVPLGGSLLVLRYALSRALRLMRRSQEELSELSEAILETYHGIPVIRGFGVEPAFLARLDRKNQAYVVTNLRLAKIRAFLIPIVGVAANFCVGGLLLWGGRGVIAGRMSVGDIAAYAAYLAMIATALTSLGWVINALQRGFLALVRIYEIFDTEPEVTPSDPEATARFLERAGGGIGIRVSHLSFSYPNQRGRRQALVDLSFEIAPGRVVGIFGMTGSGKSTLLRLLARIYDPPAGSIFLDGIDITRIDPGSLRRHLVVAPQVPFLFSQTIRENVAFGDPERKGEEGAIVAALSAAAFTEDLQALPEGLDTVVGERGVTLSGGQRQRIALARSFFRGGKLFLLDDVLSAVDQTTEERLIAEIYRQMGEDATLVITSHRLSVLQRADEILVLDQGRLIERGTHAQLVEKPGLYRDAWRYQQIVVEV